MKVSDSSHHSLLIIEDCDEDFHAVERAFNKIQTNHKLIRCVSGQDAIDYLLRQGQYEGKLIISLPRVIVLDLNLPGVDGRELVTELKTHPDLKSIPVIVFTTSKDQRDVSRCYSNGANSYIQKPIAFDKLVEIVYLIKQYWLDRNLFVER